MLRTALALLFALAGSAVAEDKPPPEFDGTYDLKEFIENGKGSDEKRAVSAVIFKDGTMTVKSATREDVAKFALDATATPHRIDFTSTGADPKVVLGIWKVDKGELTVVFAKSGARPADFRGAGEGVVKFVMARPIPPKKDK